MIAYWVRIVFVETMKHVKLSAQCTGWEGVTEMTCGWLAMFYFSYCSLFCDPSLEPSHWDDSSDGPSHIFFLRIGKDSTNWPLSPLLSWAFWGKCFLKKIKKKKSTLKSLKEIAKVCGYLSKSFFLLSVFRSEAGWETSFVLSWTT